VPDQINLEDFSKGKKLALTIESETPEDAEARRQEKSQEAKHRRRIHFWIIMLSIAVVLSFMFLVGNALLNGSPDDKKWAQPIAVAIVSSVCSGLVGFSLGKRTS
jgi:hypothetical protein